MSERTRPARIASWPRKTCPRAGPNGERSRRGSGKGNGRSGKPRPSITVPR